MTILTSTALQSQNVEQLRYALVVARQRYNQIITEAKKRNIVEYTTKDRMRGIKPNHIQAEIIKEKTDCVLLEAAIGRIES